MASHNTEPVGLNLLPDQHSFVLPFLFRNFPLIFFSVCPRFCAEFCPGFCPDCLGMVSSLVPVICRAFSWTSFSFRAEVCYCFHVRNCVAVCHKFLFDHVPGLSRVLSRNLNRFVLAHAPQSVPISVMRSQGLCAVLFRATARVLSLAVSTVRARLFPGPDRFL